MSNDAIKVRGFFRIRLVEDEATDHPRIVGDSGWRQNQVVNLGFKNYLQFVFAADAGSVQISRVALGTGGAPAAGDTGLTGELNTATYTRTTLTVATNASSRVDYQFSFNSVDSHITAAVNLSNVAVINNTTSAGTIFAGNTYTSSTWNTNQSVNGTYTITFA